MSTTVNKLHGTRKFRQSGSNFEGWGVVDEERDDPNTNKSGPSARQPNAISLAFRWQVDNSPTLNVGLVAL